MAIGKSKLHRIAWNLRFLSDAEAWVKTFTPQLKEQILDLVREQQHKREGIDADGNVIGYYSYVTSLINPKKVFNTHYTLEDTGSFHRSMFVRVFLDQIVIDANSQSYFEMQDQDWWTDRIMGLTDENIQFLIKKTRESYVNYVREILSRP